MSIRKESYVLSFTTNIKFIFDVIFFTGSNIVKRLREKLFSSVMRQEMGFFDKTRTGELVNRLSADTTLVGQSVSVNVSDGLRSVAQAIGGVGMMVSHNCMNYG